jgi:itaconate CoA-transferase
VCNLSGYGNSGPLADRKAYDLLVQTEVGLVSITGPADTPSRVGISVADIAAGMYAYSGILLALLARQESGKGTAVDVSLFDALGEWMGYAAYYASYSGAPPPRSGPHHASIAPYGPVRAGDGGQLYLGIQNAREWSRFCVEVLRQPGLETDERFASNTQRVRHRGALQAVIESAASSLTTADLIARLDAADIAWARMNTLAEYLHHPQLSERDCWREIGSPAGTLRATLPPTRLDGVEPVMGDVPSLGQQTETILGELGIDDDTIAAWRRSGAI